MDFTVAIPTYNCQRTIGTVIDYLMLQSVNPLNLIIADNGSVDGTYEMLESQMKNGYYDTPHNPRMTVTLKKFGHLEGGKAVNIPHMRRMLAHLTPTEYIFWLDSDVLLPPHALQAAFEEFKKNEDHLGLFGIRYEPKADHVQMGAAFMKTSIAQVMDWKWEGHMCDCKNVRVWLGEKMQLGTDYHETLQARHYPKFI